MNRQEFMNRLEYLLRNIPAREREDALAYYNDYFDEAGIENEYQVISELGSPEAVAEKILADVHKETGQSARKDYSSSEAGKEAYRQESAQDKYGTNKKQQMSKSTKILFVLILIFSFPLWIGLVAGLFGTAIGLLGATFGVAISGVVIAFGLLVGGIGCIIAGIARFMFSPIDALAVVGIGAILTSIGILLALLFIWMVGVWIPKLVSVIVNWIKGFVHREKGGNEI